MAKTRADAFYRLKQGEFIVFADGKDKRVRFKLQHIQKEMPKNSTQYSNEDLRLNYERIYKEVNSLFKK